MSFAVQLVSNFVSTSYVLRQRDMDPNGGGKKALCDADYSLDEQHHDVPLRLKPINFSP